MENCVTLTRKQLYDLVWSTPLSTLAKTYNISDNGIRKMCKKFEIPLPLNGYWQKIKFGKRPQMTEFKFEYAGKDKIVLELITENTVRHATIVDELAERQHQIQLALGEKLVVPEKLTRPHDLVIATKERAAASVKRDWNSNVYNLYPVDLNIAVSTPLLSRALRFFDTIIKVLKIRGHDVRADHRTTLAVLFGEEIEIRLREKDKLIKIMDGKWPRTQREPTGLLYFGAKFSWVNDKIWTDAKVPIEQQLSNIIAYLEIKAEGLREQRRLREIARKKEEDLERQRKEYEKKQELELQDFKLLLKKVDRWQQLNLIRGYINELEAKSLEQNLLSEEIKSWIEWARKKADWYDPHINAEDELLREVDKESLTFKRKTPYGW